jgi:hypothetical protein
LAGLPRCRQPELGSVTPGLKAAGPFQPDPPAALQPEAPHRREGTHHRRVVCPSVSGGFPAFLADAVRPPAAFPTPAIQDDLEAADLLEGRPYLRQEERPVGRHDGVA